MNEFLIALGDFFFAIAGLVTFYVESFCPGIIEMANSIAKRENIAPVEAMEKAEKIKKKRSLTMFIPWVIGATLSGIGILTI